MRCYDSKYPPTMKKRENQVSVVLSCLFQWVVWGGGFVPMGTVDHEWTRDVASARR